MAGLRARADLIRAMQDELEIRLLTENHISAGLRLSKLAGWNQTESDWRRLLKHDPQGGFIACLNNRVVGTTTSTAYGTDLAWIGMVLVDPDCRRRGIATQLVQETLRSLRSRGVKTIKLDATPAGQQVYSALSFVEETCIERWMGRAHAIGKMDCQIRSGPLRAEMMALDRLAFGAERSALLGSLIADSSVPPLTISAPDGQLRGFALARPGAVACYVGPIVTTDQNAATTLLDAMLDQLDGRDVFIDINPRFDVGARMVAARGFVKQRDFIRMRFGLESSAGTSSLIFAIAGPEVG
jgi:ribosomal protein S18 acetylase RimI-like enzyme